MKKFFWLFCGGLSTCLLYLTAIGVYTRIAEDPIVFFASLVIGAGVVLFICLLFGRLAKDFFDKFTIFVIGLVYYLGLIIFAVFGPTFIDRSISYHLAFYAAEEGEVYIENIEQVFSRDIFEKRMHDAVETGFLEQNQDGSMSPTFKSKIMYDILKPIGEWTGTLDTYYKMKEEVANHAVQE